MVEVFCILKEDFAIPLATPLEGLQHQGPLYGGAPDNTHSQFTCSYMGPWWTAACLVCRGLATSARRSVLIKHHPFRSHLRAFAGLCPSAGCSLPRLDAPSLCWMLPLSHTCWIPLLTSHNLLKCHFCQGVPPVLDMTVPPPRSLDSARRHSFGMAITTFQKPR